MNTISSVAQKVADKFISERLVGANFVAVCVLQKSLKNADIDSMIQHGYLIRNNEYGHRHVWLHAQNHVIDIGSYLTALTVGIPCTGLSYVCGEPPAHIDLVDRDSECDRMALQHLEELISHVKDGQLDISLKDLSTLTDIDDIDRLVA